MKQVVKHCGRFTLMQSDEGFAWVMQGAEGEPWYWHPEEAQWTVSPCFQSSPERASDGLNPDAPQATSVFHHHEGHGPREPFAVPGSPETGQAGAGRPETK
jgi:hypothetical protein